MIEAKYAPTAKELNKVYDIYWRHADGNFPKLPLLGSLLLIVYIISMYINFYGVEMLFLFGGLYCFMFPMAAKTGLKKNIKKIAGKNHILTIDDAAMTVKTDGLEVKASIDTITEVISSREGLIICMQSPMFFWLPKNAFDQNNYNKVQEILAKKAKKTTTVNKCSCCACGCS